jgi:hypothetical protein
MALNGGAACLKKQQEIKRLIAERQRLKEGTCRETEVRLAEHADWRTALGLQSAPADTTL